MTNLFIILPNARNSLNAIAQKLDILASVAQVDRARLGPLVNELSSTLELARIEVAGIQTRSAELSELANASQTKLANLNEEKARQEQLSRDAQAVQKQYESKQQDLDKSKLDFQKTENAALKQWATRAQEAEAAMSSWETKQSETGRTVAIKLKKLKMPDCLG